MGQTGNFVFHSNPLFHAFCKFSQWGVHPISSDERITRPASMNRGAQKVVSYQPFWRQ
jgi:hypothetical protein